MALLHYLWSRVAGNNASADANINWAEGQVPSSVNDSARALMASAAGFRDDISGAIVTTGTSTAYVLASYQVFNTLANMNGHMIAFTPHTTNGATVTLSVDGLGVKPLRSSTGVELQSNVLIAGTPYTATYNNSDSAWYLHSIGGNTYGIPLLAGMDFWGTSAPSSAFIFPTGQAISRTTYATSFALLGTTYGVGDGSTTFNVPDKTGRVSAMKEATATRLTTAGGGVDGATIGSANGSTQNAAILQANLPNVNFVVASGQTVSTVSTNIAFGTGGAGSTGVSLNTANSVANLNATGTVTNAGTAASGGSGTAFKIVQPTIICNYILRIIVILLSLHNFSGYIDQCQEIQQSPVATSTIA